MKAKNRNKWTKNTMKTEGYIANHLSAATIQKKKDSHSDSQGLLFVFECIVVIKSIDAQGHSLLEILHNGEVISGSHSDLDQNKCMTLLLLVEVITHSS